jgi:hypothetical protein
MASLTGNLISSTYQSILKIGTNNTASANLNNVTDGAGNVTGLYVSTATTAVSGTLAVLGNMTVSGVLAATSSNATSASYAANADLLDGRNSTVFATTGSNILVGDQTVSGSIIPGGLTYDLGSLQNPWQELYVSTGSVNFVNNGVVVSTLGVGTNGTQISGSLVVSGSVNSGLGSYSTGLYSHAEGYFTSASGNYSHAEGDKALAIGFSSHAEGYRGMASASYSHAEGDTTTAKGQYSHAEGTFTLASGLYSHAEGADATASAAYSHAEGLRTLASGSASHAEGSGSIAVTKASHAEGILTVAYGTGSHAEGINTIASGSGQHVQGAYNLHGNTTSLMVIGDGTDDNNRHDLVRAEVGSFQVSGSLNVQGTITATGSLITYAQTQPASPVPGQIYFSSADSHFYGYNGSAWVQLDN